MTKRMKRLFLGVLCIMLILVAGVLIGRYGWKLSGFKACESAGIEEVNVEENQIHIKGFYPGSFPTGFLGYHAEQVGDTLYVGFEFSGVFGIFETGDFDITIPTQGIVTQVVVKSGEDELQSGRGRKNNERVYLWRKLHGMSVERDMFRLCKDKWLPIW